MGLGDDGCEQICLHPTYVGFGEGSQAGKKLSLLEDCPVSLGAYKIKEIYDIEGFQ
jgi:hypothetical protein